MLVKTTIGTSKLAACTQFSSFVSGFATNRKRFFKILDGLFMLTEIVVGAPEVDIRIPFRFFVSGFLGEF